MSPRTTPGDVQGKVVAVIDGSQPDAGLPLDIRGTAFQNRVWQTLTQLARGETLSYAGLAARIGDQLGQQLLVGNRLGRCSAASLRAVGSGTVRTTGDRQLARAGSGRSRRVRLPCRLGIG